MNIYVGNLSYETNNGDLQTLFASFGNVSSAKVVTDMQTGKCKGFGFVEMEAQEDAKRAISELNGTELKGRSITVNEARPKTDRGGSSRSTPGAFGRRNS